jgi:hypothetical protein
MWPTVMRASGAPPVSFMNAASAAACTFSRVRPSSKFGVTPSTTNPFTRMRLPDSGSNGRSKTGGISRPPRDDGAAGMNSS